MSRVLHKDSLTKTSSGSGNSNSLSNESNSWSHAFGAFSNVLDRKTIQIKNLSETIDELDSLKKLTQDASTEVLNAATIFINGAINTKKFLSPDQINSQIRKIMDAESLLLETRLQAQIVDDVLNVEVLRNIRKRLLQAVNRAEALSMDVRNDRTLLSEIEEDISLAVKKARATAQLNDSREEALKCGDELEALTKIRRNLMSAIEKAESVDIDVSSELSVAESIESALEKAREAKGAQSNLKKVMSKAESVSTDEKVDSMSKVQHELSLAIDRASAAGIATDDARRIEKDFQKAVEVTKQNIKAKEDAFLALQSAFSETKSVSEDNDFAFVRSVKKQLDIAIQEARQWDIDVIAEESLTKEMAKSIDAAERKDQANKQLKAAHHRFKSHKISDDVDLLSDIHEEMKSAIRRASQADIDVTDDRVKARELKLRIGVMQNFSEARNQLESARKKSQKVSLDASSRTLQKIVRQLSSAIELAQASGMDEQKGYFGTTLLKPDHDRLERLTDAINLAKQKENAQRQLSFVRKKATTLPNDSSADSAREVREEFLKAIDNANKAGLEVSEGMLGSRLLNADQRLLDNLNGAVEFANKVATVRKELSSLSVEVQSLDEDADIGKLQELSDSLKEAVRSGAELGLKVSGEKKLLNDLNGAIDLNEKRVFAVSELTEVEELARSLPENENLESQQILRDRFERAVNSTRSLNVETSDAQTQLSMLNSKVSNAIDKMAAEGELNQAQEMADSLSSDASRGSLVKARERLVTAAEWGKTAGINISGGYFGKSVITVAEDKINDLAKKITLFDHRTEAKKHLLNVRKEAMSLDLIRTDELSLHELCDNMANALKRAINTGISIDEDEKLLDELEQALSKLIREKSDSSKALESSLNNAQSASVEEGLEKLKEIRENLISAISWAEELGLDITANKMILGELSEKVEKADEQSAASSRLHKLRGKVKDNLSKPHLKTLLTLRKSLNSAIENGELTGLDVSRDKDLSSDLEASLAIARERDELEANLNSIRSKADSALPENGSIDVKTVRDKLQVSMARGDSLGVDLRRDNDRLDNLSVIIEQAEERESALTQLKELKQEAEHASGDEATLEKFRDKLISSIERCTAAGVVDVSSENLLVDKLNQEINAILERSNAEIELREALNDTSDEVSREPNLEELTSKRDRLSAAIDRAQLSAIDVSNEMDKLNELDNSVLETVENTEAELQLANARQSVKQTSSDDNPTVLRSLHNSLGNAVERAEKVGIEVAEDHQTLRDLKEKIDCADELNKVQEIAEEVITGIDSQSIEEALNTLHTVIERADTLGLQTDKYQVLSNEMKTTLERLAQEKVEAQEALSAARLQEQVLSEDSDPAMIEKTRDALLDAVHQADASGIDVAEDQVKVDQLDEMAKRAREKLEAKEQLIKAREDVEAIFMDDDPDALSVVHKFLIAAVGRASYCEIDVKQDEKRIEELEDAISFARSRQEAKTELLKARESVESLSESSDIVTLRNSRDQLLQAITHAESLGLDVSSYQDDVDRLDEEVDKTEEDAKAYDILDESSPHTNLAESYDVFNAGESASSDESSSVGQLSDENDKTEYYHGQNEISIIDDVNVLKEFSNPTRKAIVQCLYTIPRYPEEIAKEINFPREKIYYHLRKLLHVNLIFVADTKVINGISKKKYLNIARSFQISPSLYESQLFVETGFPIAENPEAMKEKKTTAQSSALPTKDEKEEIKIKEEIIEPVASDSEEDEFIYEASNEIEDTEESTPDEAQLDEEKEIQKTKIDSEDQGELIHDSTDVQESNNEDLKEDEEERLIEDNDEKTVEDTPSDDVQQKVQQQQVVVEKIVVEQKPQKIVIEQKPQKIVIEQNPQQIVVEQTGKAVEGQGQEDQVNALLTTLLKFKGDETPGSKTSEIIQATQESLAPTPGSGDQTPLTKSFTIDDQQYLVPEFELTPEGIDLAVRNARKADGGMMTVEEKTLLRDHLLSLRVTPTLYDDSENLEGTLDLSEQELLDPAEKVAKSPLVTFFNERTINYYRRLKGYSKAVTIVKSRDKVTFLLAEMKGDSFVISKAKSFELPFETEDVIVEGLPQFIHYIYNHEIPKKAWKKYYLGFYSSDYPIETDFLTVPKMSKDELSMFLGNRIAERFSVEKDKVVMNWLSYGEKEKDETEITSCCLFMDRKSISQDCNFLLKRGIQARYVTSILKVQFNIYRDQCKDTSSGDSILIYFGHKKSRVTIVNNWKIISSRELLMGLENFVQGYRDAAFTIEESQEMTYSEICNLFFETGLPAQKDDPKPEDDEEDEKEPVSGNYNEIINSVTSKYLSEIYATLRDFKLKGMRMGGEYYGSGPGIAIPNILEIVSGSIEKNVEPLNLPLETMLKEDFEGDLGPEDRQQFMQNLGLILDPSEELSLLPEEYRSELKWFFPTRLIQIVIGIIFAFSTLFIALGYSSMKKVENQIPPKQLELQTATAHQSEYLTYFKDLQAVKGFLSVQEYDRMAGRKIIYLLQYLTNITSEKIVMYNISSKAVAEQQNSITPIVLTLQGEVMPPSGETKIILNNFIYLLKNSDRANKVSLLQSLDMTEGSLSFIIEIEL